MSTTITADKLPLVKLEQHGIALLFANYLKSLGVSAEVVAEEEGFVVCCGEADIPRAHHEFEAFIKQPHHPKYQQAAWDQGESVDVSANGNSLIKEFRKNFLSHAGIITLTVFVLCWLVFIASEMGMARAIFDKIHFYTEFNIATFVEHPWRLLGPAFFHFGLLHIAFNTMWWWQLGGSIEKLLGKGTLITLFLLSAIASNVAQFYVSGPNFGGLSGVVYALVGFVWWFGYLAPHKGLSLSKPIIGFLLVWLLLGFADLLPVNIANTAHLVGLVVGCLLALIVAQKHNA